MIGMLTQRCNVCNTHLLNGCKSGGTGRKSVLDVLENFTLLL